MNGIIIYKSTYGSTRQYAEWLREETGYKCLDVKKVKKKDITEAEVVIIGCPVLAYKPLLAKWIQKKWNLLAGKKVVLYTTSGAAPGHPSLRKGFESSFPPEIKAKLKYFPQGGRMIISELTPLHKFFMNMGMKMEKDPKIRAEMAKDKDEIDRNGLSSLLKYIKA